MAKKRVSVYLSDDQVKELDGYCVSHNCGQSEALRDAALRAIRNNGSTIRASKIESNKNTVGAIVDSILPIPKPVSNGNPIDKDREIRLAKARAAADEYIKSIGSNETSESLQRALDEKKYVVTKTKQEAENISQMLDFIQKLSKKDKQELLDLGVFGRK